MRLGGRGDVTASHRLWRQFPARPRVGSSVIHEGYHYGIRANGILDCIALETGKVVWAERLVGGFRGRDLPANPSGALVSWPRTAYSVKLMPHVRAVAEGIRDLSIRPRRWAARIRWRASAWHGPTRTHRFLFRFGNAHRLPVRPLEPANRPPHQGWNGCVAVKTCFASPEGGAVRTRGHYSGSTPALSFHHPETIRSVHICWHICWPLNDVLRERSPHPEHPSPNARGSTSLWRCQARAVSSQYRR